MGTTIHTAQGSLFDPTAGLPQGLGYEAAFIERAEERALIDVIAALPLREARYKEYTARRRVYAFGARFDFEAYQLQPQPIGGFPAAPPGFRAGRVSTSSPSGGSRSLSACCRRHCRCCASAWPCGPAWRRTISCT